MLLRNNIQTCWLHWDGAAHFCHPKHASSVDSLKESLMSNHVFAHMLKKAWNEAQDIKHVCLLRRCAIIHSNKW